MVHFELTLYRQSWYRMLEAAKHLARVAQVRGNLVPSCIAGQPSFYDPMRADCVGWEIDEGFVMQTLEDDYLTDAVIAESYILRIIAHGPICCHCLWNDSNNRVKGEHW
jgi:hypothetical protein